MRKAWIGGALFLFIGAIPLYAQQRPVPALSPGTYPMAMQDSVDIAGAGKDTSDAVAVNCIDFLSYYAQYHSRNDSINIEVYADFSPDGLHWLHTVGLDTALVSGTADAIEAKRVDFFPDWALFARCRVVGAHASTDTVDVSVWWHKTYFGVMRFR